MVYRWMMNVKNAYINTNKAFSLSFIQYNATSLEKNYKYELLAEHDLGITIDLINPEAYAQQSDGQLHDADEKLLEEDTTAHGPTDKKR